MRSTSLMIALLSLIPSAGICVFVYFKDKKEKEPLWLLGAIFGASAALFFPAYYFGNDVINRLLGRAFAAVRCVDPRVGVVWNSAAAEYLHNGLCALLGAALIEELVRWLILYVITSRSRHFNCTFDGVVYSVTASMGAVVAKSVRIALVSSWDQFLLRFVHAFPWYLLFGVVTGVLYSYWHLKKSADSKENELIREKKLGSDKLKYPVGALILSVAAPVLLHAIYSFAAEQRESRSTAVNVALYAAAALMLALCVVFIVALSKRDRTEREAMEEIIEREHGDLPDEYFDGGEKRDGE